MTIDFFMSESLPGKAKAYMVGLRTHSYYVLYLKQLCLPTTPRYLEIRVESIIFCAYSLRNLPIHRTCVKFQLHDKNQIREKSRRNREEKNIFCGRSHRLSVSGAQKMILANKSNGDRLINNNNRSCSSNNNHVPVRYTRIRIEIPWQNSQHYVYCRCIKKFSSIMKSSHTVNK